MAKVSKDAMPKIVYDVEVVPNAYTVRMKRVDNGHESVYYVDSDPKRKETVVAELKKREPYLKVLNYTQFSQVYYETAKIGFNTEEYDSFVLPAMINKETPEKVYKISQALIQPNTPYASRKQPWQIRVDGQKLKKEYSTLDVRKQFLKDPEARKLSEGDDSENSNNTGSLKDQEVKLNMNVHEFELDFNDPNLTSHDIANLIVYNGDDVDATEAVYKRPEIQGNIEAKNALIELTKKRVGANESNDYKYDSMINKTSRQITDTFITKDNHTAPLKVKKNFTLQNEKYLDVYDQLGMSFVKQGYLQYFKDYEKHFSIELKINALKDQIREIKKTFGYGKLGTEQQEKVDKLNHEISDLFVQAKNTVPHLKWYAHKSFVTKEKIDKKTKEVIEPSHFYETADDVPYSESNGRKIHVRTTTKYRGYDGSLMDQPPVPMMGKMEVVPSYGGIHAALPYAGPAVHLDLSSYYKLIIENRRTLGDLSEAQDILFDLKEKAGKEGKKGVRAGAKVGLNAISGALDSQYGHIKNNLAMTETRIYGQAIIIALAKMLRDAGYNPVHLNTDGIYLDDNGKKLGTVEWNNYVNNVAVIAKNWADRFNMELKPETVDWFEQKDANNRREDYGGKIKVGGGTLNGSEGNINVNNNYKMPYVSYDAALATITNDDVFDNTHTKIRNLHGMLSFMKAQAVAHPEKFRYPVKAVKGTVTAIGHVEGQKNETGTLSMDGTLIELFNLSKSAPQKITGFPTNSPAGLRTKWTQHLEPVNKQFPIDLNNLNYEAYVQTTVSNMVEPWNKVSKTARLISEQWSKWQEHAQTWAKSKEEKNEKITAQDEEQEFENFLGQLVEHKSEPAKENEPELEITR